MAAQPLTHVYLQFTPAPRCISESRAIYRALRKFGEINMFKVVRHDTTTKDLAPKAHLIYKKASSGASLIAASPLKVPPTRVTLTGAESGFPHEVYIRYVSRGRAIRGSSLLNKRRFVVGYGAKEDDEKGGDEAEGGGGGGEGFRVEDVGGGGNSVGTKAWGSVEKRLLKRFTGGFCGFDGMLGEKKATVMESAIQGKWGAKPTVMESAIQGKWGAKPTVMESAIQGKWGAKPTGERP